MILISDSEEKILVKGWLDYIGYLFKFKIYIHRSRKSNPDVMQIHVEVNLSPHVKGKVSIRHDLHKGLSSNTATSHEKADTIDINIQFFCQFLR